MLSASIFKSIFEFRIWIPNVSSVEYQLELAFEKTYARFFLSHFCINSIRISELSQTFPHQLQEGTSGICNEFLNTNQKIPKILYVKLFYLLMAMKKMIL